jgi:hypothetical protein
VIQPSALLGIEVQAVQPLIQESALRALAMTVHAIQLATQESGLRSAGSWSQAVGSRTPMPWYLRGWHACYVVESGTRSVEPVVGLPACWICKAEEEENCFTESVAVRYAMLASGAAY